MSDRKARLYYTVENGPLRSKREVEQILSEQATASGTNGLYLFTLMLFAFVALLSVIFGVMTGAVVAMGLTVPKSPPPSPPPSPSFPLPKPPPMHPPPTSPAPSFPPGAPKDRPQEPPPPPSMPPPFSPYPPVSPFHGPDGVACTNAVSRQACASLQQLYFGLAHAQTLPEDSVAAVGDLVDNGACAFCVSNHQTSFTHAADIPAGMTVLDYCTAVAASGVCSCVC